VKEFIWWVLDVVVLLMFTGIGLFLLTMLAAAPAVIWNMLRRVYGRGDE
jgi:ABC-type multidrug transport system permease subunit